MAPRKKYPTWQGQGKVRTNGFQLEDGKNQNCQEIEELTMVGKNITIRAGSNVITETSDSNLEVARILAIFKNPLDGDNFWAKILWFYSADYIAQECRPQVYHGDPYKSTSFLPFKQELFASKHVDHIPVWSIYDIAHVLTYSSYRREMARRCQVKENMNIPSALYERDLLTRREVVDIRINSNRIFFCRHVFNPITETILGFGPKELPDYKEKRSSRVLVRQKRRRGSRRKIIAKRATSESKKICDIFMPTAM